MSLRRKDVEGRELYRVKFPHKSFTIECKDNWVIETGSNKWMVGAT